MAGSLAAVAARTPVRPQVPAARGAQGANCTGAQAGGATLRAAVMLLARALVCAAISALNSAPSRWEIESNFVFVASSFAFVASSFAFVASSFAFVASNFTPSPASRPSTLATNLKSIRRRLFKAGRRPVPFTAVAFSFRADELHLAVPVDKI
jgi:hypothetical protein